MAEYRVRILKAASQDLERLDKPVARRVAPRINWLSENLDAIRIHAIGHRREIYRRP
jgi:mRNA-degrading endonuclease RelE of RelBE toxin-antitoxin system